MRFKTATMLMTAVIAVSVVIPIAASGSPGPLGNPTTYRVPITVLSTEANIEARHRALGRLDLPVPGPLEGRRDSPTGRAGTAHGLESGDAAIVAAAVLGLAGTVGVAVILRRRKSVATPAIR